MKSLAHQSEHSCKECGHITLNVRGLSIHKYRTRDTNPVPRAFRGQQAAQNTCTVCPQGGSLLYSHHRHRPLVPSQAPDVSPRQSVVAPAEPPVVCCLHCSDRPLSYAPWAAGGRWSFLRTALSPRTAHWPPGHRRQSLLDLRRTADPGRDDRTPPEEPVGLPPEACEAVSLCGRTCPL